MTMRGLETNRMARPFSSSMSATTTTRYRISACIGQHLGDRAEQQDRAGIYTSRRAAGCMLAILADGMGGRTGGALAAEQVVATAGALFEEFDPARQTATDLLTEIIRDAHTIIQLSAVTSEKEPHSTIVAMVLQPGQINWAHVGDSRLYYFKSDRLQFRTSDHSYVEQLVQSGKLSREAAASHRMGHVLTNALGTRKTPIIDFGETRDPGPGDSFLLCSDGLWHYFSDDELGQTIHRLTPRRASEILVEQARDRARGRGDNCTLAIVKLSAASDSA